MAHEYATSAELKATLELTGETFADADVALALTAASRGIDNATRRRFWLDADNTSVRYYTPRSCSLLEIDDVVDLVELATGTGDGSFATAWTENTDHVLEPLNAAADGRPQTMIKPILKSLPTQLRSVRVTGQFGWPAVPDGIKQGTIILASKLLRRAREAPFGVIMFSEGEVARITRADPDVMFLIGPYIKRLVR